MSNKITTEVVRHIAKLSRIEIGDAELEKFTSQFGDIVEYIGKLQELDTENVEPMAHAVELTNVLADDVVGEQLTTEAALSNAPAREGSFFKVPRILGESS